MNIVNELRELKGLHDKKLITLAAYEERQKVLLNRCDARISLTHLDQYKMLREEIMQNIRVMDNVQYASALLPAGMYAWLILNRVQMDWPPLWFVPAALLVYCGFKYQDLNQRIWHIAIYLKRIEVAAFGNDSRLPGWECFKESHKLGKRDKILHAIKSVVWIILIVGSIYVSWHLSHNVAAPNQGKVGQTASIQKPPP